MVVLLAGVLLLSGCSTIGNMAGKVGALVGIGTDRGVEPLWRSVAVVASEDANGNSPVALDLVFVRDATLATALATLPADRWFAGRTDTLRSNPDNVSTISLELVPGQTVRLREKDFEGRRALAVFAYAGYPAPGDHRIRLQLDANAYLVQLGARDFKATVVRPADLK